MTTETAPIRLNIGSGDTKLEGFTPIDKKFGGDALDLKYDDGSVEEIRASHILEHFSYRDAEKALKEWNRVLKIGGKLRVSVPDWDKLKACSLRNNSERFMLMGGQTDENDFHRSMFDWGLLTGYLEQCGFSGCQKWESQNTDTASNPISLNIEAFKKDAVVNTTQISWAAVMSTPRLGWNATWGCIIDALRNFGQLAIRRFEGVYWGQCMQRLFNDCVADGIDWIITIDYDSVFTSQHLQLLFDALAANPAIDAIAALQIRRQQQFPLITLENDSKNVVIRDGKKELVIGKEPIQVATAHFGLTVIRTESLKDVKKPWFFGQPDENGEWSDKRLDDDIWFWKQWREAGKTIYMLPECRIGHLEVMVGEYDENMKPRHIYVSDWRARELPQTVGKA